MLLLLLALLGKSGDFRYLIALKSEKPIAL